MLGRLPQTLGNYNMRYKEIQVNGRKIIKHYGCHIFLYMRKCHEQKSMAINASISNDVYLTVVRIYLF